MVSFVIGLEFFGIGLILVALLLLINGDGAREQKLLIFMVLVRKWGDRQLNQMSNSPLILTSRFV